MSVPLVWAEAQQAAFDDLKAGLARSLALSQVENDPDSQFIVATDASGCGPGAALFQKVAGQRRLIAVQSKSFTTAKHNYATIEKEALAAA